jgi:plasmid stabilization system protein ParE
VPRLVLTPAAQANLIEIADYIESESGSIDLAERFVDRLLAKCEDLAALPGQIGRQRSE